MRLDGSRVVFARCFDESPSLFVLHRTPLKMAWPWSAPQPSNGTLAELCERLTEATENTNVHLANIGKARANKKGLQKVNGRAGDVVDDVTNHGALLLSPVMAPSLSFASV